jgi:hypothetical protein
MDTAKIVLERIAHLITSVRDPKDADELRIVQHQIEMLQQEHLATQKETRKVTADNLELASKVKVLEQQIARLKVEGKEIVAGPDEFIEYLGVLFSRKAGGRYHRKPFCAKCRRAMKEVSPQLPFTCSGCKTSTPFKALEINDVILRLEKS